MIPIRYNLRNLLVRWKTTLLTAVGFMLVVALLVVMLAFVNGLSELSKKTGPAGNVIVLRDGANDELFSDLMVNEPLEEIWTRKPLSDLILPNPKGQDGKMVSKEVYSIATQELPAREGERPSYRFLQVRGVEDPEAAGAVHGLRLREGGRWLSRTGNEVVMGEGIARTLGLRLGDQFKPRPNLEWTVVGLLDSRGSPFDSEIWAKREEVGLNFGKDNPERGEKFYTSVIVTTRDFKTAQEFAGNLQKHTQVRVNPMTERKYYEEMSKSNQIFLEAATVIAVVMAVGGMFGLMTTMFAAVSQRIKDIGVLRVLGYRRRHILLSFLLESLLLAVVGGGLGLLIGCAVNGVEQTGVMSSGQGGTKTVVFTMVVNRAVVLTAVGFTLAMGLLGGLLPALSAMRLKLLESLR